MERILAVGGLVVVGGLAVAILALNMIAQAVAVAIAFPLTFSGIAG